MRRSPSSEPWKSRSPNDYGWVIGGLAAPLSLVPMDGIREAMYGFWSSPPPPPPDHQLQYSMQRWGLIFGNAAMFEVDHRHIRLSRHLCPRLYCTRNNDASSILDKYNLTEELCTV
ncbi:hypothetical protein BHE74_00013368 [Ensete ventricosum]|uniref:Uncharacterized protein n=1 Tax=Ensete ventricosum TaxID=4639 RepID=A0A445M9L0_ENSVE|nr:hypothetical protein BHE74_00013368 [Ensete ventricosum]RZR70927.1 hypothetical protein BHM03_00002336 [Ensete ventricosum]